MSYHLSRSGMFNYMDLMICPFHEEVKALVFVCDEGSWTPHVCVINWGHKEFPLGRLPRTPVMLVRFEHEGTTCEFLSCGRSDSFQPDSATQKVHDQDMDKRVAQLRKEKVV